MDLSPSELSFSRQPLWFSFSSDSDFCSLSSPETVVSPAGSLEPSCSPVHLPTWPGCPMEAPPSCQQGSASKGKRRRTWSKNPSKERQNASEKEKLRMRDLTKALHHLRTYLPPSVAPPGQTLTKIATLRLAIHYIAHLSAQLGLDEEDFRRRKDPPAQGHQAFPQQPSSMVGQWEEGQGWHVGYSCTTAPLDHPSADSGSGYSHLNGSLCTAVHEDVFSCDLDSLLASPQGTDPANTRQMNSSTFSCQGFPLDFWT